MVAVLSTTGEAITPDAITSVQATNQSTTKNLYSQTHHPLALPSFRQQRYRGEVNKAQVETKQYYAIATDTAINDIDDYVIAPKEKRERYGRLLF